MITEIEEKEIKEALHFWLFKEHNLIIPTNKIKLSVDMIGECVRCTFETTKNEGD